jgi:GT2 family glycosyltransferase
MNYPLVTVFTLIYNTNPKFIIDAIISIQNNNYPNIQHIILDDCSSKAESKNEVKKWIQENNYPCEFYENSQNLGICKSLNIILEKAKGKYFLGCCDDLIPEGRIWKDVEVFSQLDDSYAIVYSLSQEIDIQSVKQPRVFPCLVIPEDENYWNRLVNNNCLSAPATTYRTSILKKHGGFNEQIRFEDYEINLRLSNLGYKFKCIPEILSYYRIHNDSVSNKLNFNLEEVRILALFNENKDIKVKIYEKTWNLIYFNNPGAAEAVHIFEKVYNKSWKLRLALKLKNKRILMMLNRIIKLDRTSS